MQTTTVKQKGNKVTRYEGKSRVISELVWQGGIPGRPYTEDQQYYINKIIGIRCEIRRQAQQAEDDKMKYYQDKMAKENNMIGNIIDVAACNLVEKACQRKYELKQKEATERGVKYKHLKMREVNQKTGRFVITLN